MLVIEWPSFHATKGDGLKRTLEILSNLISDTSGIGNSIFFIINKTDDSINKTHVLNSIRAHQTTIDADLPNKKNLAKSTDEKILAFLKLMESNVSNIILMDMFNENMQCKTDLFNKLKEAKSIQKHKFNFSNYDPIRVKFDKQLNDIAHESGVYLKKTLTLMNEIRENETKIASEEAEVLLLQEEIQNAENSRGGNISVNNDTLRPLIERYKREIEKFDEKILACDTAIRELERDKNNLNVNTAYQVGCIPINEPRMPFWGLLARTKSEVKYEHVTFNSVIYKKQNGAPVEMDKIVIHCNDGPNQRFHATYTSNYGENGDANFYFYMPTKDIETNKKRIKDIEETDIPAKNTEKTNLTTDRDKKNNDKINVENTRDAAILGRHNQQALTVMITNYTQQVNNKNFSIQTLQNQQVISNLELTSRKNTINEKMLSYEFINQIAVLLGLKETAIIKEFIKNYFIWIRNETLETAEFDTISPENIGSLEDIVNQLEHYRNHSQFESGSSFIESISPSIRQSFNAMNLLSGFKDLFIGLNVFTDEQLRCGYLEGAMDKIHDFINDHPSYKKNKFIHHILFNEIKYHMLSYESFEKLFTLYLSYGYDINDSLEIENKQTFLHEVLKQSQVDSVKMLDLAKLLIKLNAKLNMKNNDQETSLSIAIKYQNTSFIELLISNAANLLDYSDANNNTLLHQIINYGHTIKISNELLYEKFISIAQKQIKGLLEIRNCRGQTPLLVAAKNNLTDIVIDLIDNHGAAVTVVDNENKGILDYLLAFPLSRFSLNPIIKLIEKLKKENFTPNFSILHEAIRKIPTDKSKIANYQSLISNLILLFPKTKLQELLLSKNNNEYLVEFIMKIIDEDLKYYLIELFIPKKSSLNLNILAFFIQNNQTYIFKNAYSRCIADKNILNTRLVTGETLLGLAIYHENIELIELLLKKSNLQQSFTLNYFEGHQNYIFSPLRLAIIKGNLNIVKLLLEDNRDILSKDIDENKNSIYHLALINNQQNIFKSLWKIIPNSFLSHKNQEGLTLLHLTINLEYTDIFDLLMTKCNEQIINEPTPQKNTALHLAVIKGNSYFVNILCERGGVKFWVENKDNKDPLALAIDKSDDIQINLKNKILKDFLKKITLSLKAYLKNPEKNLFSEWERRLNSVILTDSTPKSEALRNKIIQLDHECINDYAKKISINMANTITAILQSNDEKNKYKLFFDNELFESFDSRIIDIINDSFNQIAQPVNSSNQPIIEEPFLKLTTSDIIALKKKAFTSSFKEALRALFYINQAIAKGEVEFSSGGFNTATSLFQALSPLFLILAVAQLV